VRDLPRCNELLREGAVGVNLWFEHVIAAWLLACSEGRDWREAVAEADRAAGRRVVLTQRDLKAKMGIPYSRQHIGRKVRRGAFPAPFQAP
jgi:hypothetical protein